VLDADQVTAVAADVPDHYRTPVMAGAGLLPERPVPGVIAGSWHRIWPAGRPTPTSV
jgi:hypothetical protein